MSLTLHVVPHTHWDREWYLPFQEFRIRLVHLMDRLLDILSRDGTYRHFMLDGQSILLEDYLEIRPDRAETISQFVRVGRLSIGPWYVLPDEFLVAPESLVRNLMLGGHVCSRFGTQMLIGYVPDSFGHLSQLPQIMRGFGIETVAFRRGLAEEPAELWWDAPDGSRVLVCYLRDGYDNVARLPVSDVDSFATAICSARDSLAPHVTSGHLLLLAGTDHQEPQPELPALVAEVNDEWLGKDRLLHSSLPAFAEAVRESIEPDTLDSVAGELRSPQRHHLLPGVLSARMWIKQRNDAVETLLTQWTEPFAAWAELVDAVDTLTDARQRAHLTGHEPLCRVRQPEDLIWHAWRLLLENHPHDSICGCSVDQVHREMASRFDQAEQIGQEVTTQSLTAIAENVDTRPPDPHQGEIGAPQPLVVFNPIGGPRTDLVTAQLRLPAAPDAIEVVGPDGQVVAHQVAVELADMERDFFHIEVTPEELATYIGLVEGGRLLNHVIHQVELRRTGDEMEITLVVSESGEPEHVHLAAVRAQVEDCIAAGDVSRFVVRSVVAETHDLTFLAPDLPAYGYATFFVRPVEGHGKGDYQKTSGANTLENGLFHLQASPVDGSLILTDKTTGVVYSGLNRFVDGGDRGDEYNYCQPEEDRVISEPVAPPAIRVIEDGPARQTMEIAQVFRLPRSLRSDRRGRSEEMVNVSLVSRVSLSPDVPRIEIETTVDNLAQDHRLRVHFPVPVSVDHAHTEAHFHVARRPIPPIPADLDTSDWVEQPAPTVPQRGWADVSDGQVGFMLANRGLPEVEFIPGEDQTTIALTLLRCVGWLSRGDMHCRQGHAGPELPTPEAQCLGRNTYHYALIPHAGHWSQVRAQADAFRAPLRAIAAGIHEGSLPPVNGLVQAEPPSFTLTAIKQPKQGSGSGLIVRGVNLSEEPVAVRLRLWRNLDRVARVNLNEDFLEPLLAESDGTVTTSARPWEIVTVRWREA